MKYFHVSIHFERFFHKNPYLFTCILTHIVGIFTVIQEHFLHFVKTETLQRI